MPAVGGLHVVLHVAGIPADEICINEQIQSRLVRVIGSDGTQHGVKTVPEALAIAREEGPDLVEIARPPVDPPICKIMNYRK